MSGWILWILESKFMHGFLIFNLVLAIIAEVCDLIFLVCVCSYLPLEIRSCRCFPRNVHVHMEFHVLVEKKAGQMETKLRHKPKPSILMIIFTIYTKYLKYNNRRNTAMTSPLIDKTKNEFISLILRNVCLVLKMI